MTASLFLCKIIASYCLGRGIQPAARDFSQWLNLPMKPLEYILLVMAIVVVLSL